MVFCDIFGRPDFCRMILLFVFWTVLLTILFRRDDVTALCFFCWINISDLFFLIFGSSIFCEIHVSYAQIFRDVPLLSFIHDEKCVQGGPLLVGLRGWGSKNLGVQNGGKFSMFKPFLPFLVGFSFLDFE